MSNRGKPRGHRGYMTSTRMRVESYVLSVGGWACVTAMGLKKVEGFGRQTFDCAVDMAPDDHPIKRARWETTLV